MFDIKMCVICRNDLKDQHILSCNHPFHQECWLEWKKESNNCPICFTEQATLWDSIVKQWNLINQGLMEYNDYY